jgi:hypothetical protein
MDTKICKPVLEPTNRGFIDAPAAQGEKPIHQLSIVDEQMQLE